jgi:hypothetical protein
MGIATDSDYKVIAAMEKYGGGFVVALANAARHADFINLSKIKSTFNEYWIEYAEMAGVDGSEEVEQITCLDCHTKNCHETGMHELQAIWMTAANDVLDEVAPKQPDDSKERAAALLLQARLFLAFAPSVLQWRNKKRAVLKALLKSPTT